MTGVTIAIDDAAATDTILSVKERVFAANCQLPVHRQRLMYRPGPHGIEPLADDETLGGAGVAQDGSAELDVLLAEMTAVDVKALSLQVSFLEMISSSPSGVILLYGKIVSVSSAFFVLCALISCLKPRKKVIRTRFSSYWAKAPTLSAKKRRCATFCDSRVCLIVAAYRHCDLV